MKRFIFTLSAIFFLNEGFAQKPALNTYSYNSAIGIRAGGTSGLTYKQHLGSGNAAEFILGFWDYGFGLTGLYEKQNNAGIAGLNWYYGFGGHIAAFYNHPGYYNYYSRGERRYFISSDYYNEHFGVGIDGIVGIEYKIRPIPFAISLDLKPFIEVTNNGSFISSLDPGLGIKFTF